MQADWYSNWKSVAAKRRRDVWIDTNLGIPRILPVVKMWTVLFNNFVGGEWRTIAGGQTRSEIGKPGGWNRNRVQSYATMDAAGRRTLLQRPSGARTSYTYDAADSLTQKFHLKPNGDVSSGFVYTIDRTGRRTAVAETNGDRTTWTCDSDYQLVNEQRSGANSYNTTFVCDAAANRIAKSADSALTTWTYDAASQITTEETMAGVSTYTFDANGNQKVVEHPDSKRTTWTWDYENQNTRIELPNGSFVTMIYNADHRRVDRRP